MHIALLFLLVFDVYIACGKFMCLKWESLTKEEQLVILLSEKIRNKNFHDIKLWMTPGNALLLINAMQQRGRLWNLNKLKQKQQLLYIENEKAHIQNDWKNNSIKTCLWRMLAAC